MANAADCDDGNGAVNPDADEVCNALDDDCDGSIDVGALDATAWYLDDDGDDYGDPDEETIACEAPTDHVADATDCNDGAADVNPGADELPSLPSLDDSPVPSPESAGGSEGEQGP